MTFKAKLFTPVVFTINNQPPGNHYLEFTKNQIIVPEKFKDVMYENSAIKDKSNYSIKIYDNVDIRFRYEITICNSAPIRLWVSKKEEKKLRSIHGLSWYEGVPIKWDLIKLCIGFIFTILTSLLVFLLNNQSTQKKFEQQKVSINNLNARIVLLEKDLGYKGVFPDSTKK